MQRFFLTLPIMATLGACSSAPPPGSPEDVALKHQAKVELTKTAASDVPDWYMNPPKDDRYVYAAGTALSGDMQFAIDKAIMNAKFQLADQVAGKMSGTHKDYLKETTGSDPAGTSERTSSAMINDVALPGYQVVQKKVVPVDTQYRSYVLVQFAAAHVDTPQQQAALTPSAIQKQADAAQAELQAAKWKADMQAAQWQAAAHAAAASQEPAAVADPVSATDAPKKKVVAYPIGMPAPDVPMPAGVLVHPTAPREPAGEPPLPAAAPRPAVEKDDTL